MQHIFKLTYRISTSNLVTIKQITEHSAISQICGKRLTWQQQCKNRDILQKCYHQIVQKTYPMVKIFGYLNF